MKATEVVIPKDAYDERHSPLSSEKLTEYAIEAGGSVLNNRRYATPEDAYFYGCVLQNARDRERFGRVMIKRRVVRRRVTFGKWEPVERGAK